MEHSVRLATHVFYVFKIKPPIDVANDDPSIPRNIVAVGFNFDVAEQKIDTDINCPYYDLAMEYGYKPRYAVSPAEHLMCVEASRNGKKEKISTVQAQRNIQRYRMFLVKEESHEQDVKAEEGTGEDGGEQTPQPPPSG